MFSKIASVLQPSSDKLFLTGASFKGRVVENLVCWSITQQFINNEKQSVELLYHFPLGASATLVSVNARIGDRQFSCEVSAKSQAKMNYTDAMAQGDSAILIEQDDELRYFMRIGNIMPGEQIEITLQTSEFLKLTHGSARISVPTCLPNSYSLSGNYAQHPVTVSASQKHKLAAELKLTGSLRNSRIFSPSHKLRFNQAGEALLIEVAGDAFLDRDFVLNMDEFEAQSPTGFWFQNPDMNADLPGAYLGVLNYVARQAEPSQQGIQLKLLLDCSGSMDGQRMESAKSALQCLIPKLRMNDRVSFSRFGSTCENLIEATALVTSQVRKGLGEWIEETQANFGGTEMADALKCVADITHFGQADVLLITDGEVDGLPEMVEAAQETTHRIFVLTIGANPQESLLSTLAHTTGGAVEFVQQACDIEAAVARLFETLRSRTYTGVRLHCEGLVEHSQVAPQFGFEGCSFPILFSSSAPAFGVALHLDKRTSTGEARPELASIPFRLIDDSEMARAVCKLWASQRFDALMDHERLNPCSGEMAATELAVRFGLVTPLTSACLTLLRGEAERNPGLPLRHVVPSMVAIDSMVSSSSPMFCRSVSSSTADFSIPSKLMFREDNRLTYGVSSTYKHSPEQCVEVLAELPEHLIPTSFEALLILGFPEDVLDWCKLIMADLLLAQGEGAVVKQILLRLAQGRFGGEEWTLEQVDWSDLSTQA